MPPHNEKLPAGFAAGYELDYVTGLWLPHYLCRGDKFLIVIDDLAQLDALPSMQTLACAMAEKMIAKKIEQIFSTADQIFSDPAKPAAWPGLSSATGYNFTSTNSTSPKLTTQSLYDLVKKFPPPPPDPFTILPLSLLFSPPPIDEGKLLLAKAYADYAPQIKCPPLSLMQLTADPIGPSRKEDRPFVGEPTKSRATIINEQDILRAVAGDQAEYVWSEFLRAHVRIAEDLKLKPRSR